MAETWSQLKAKVTGWIRENPKQAKRIAVGACAAVLLLIVIAGTVSCRNGESSASSATGAVAGNDEWPQDGLLHGIRQPSAGTVTSVVQGKDSVAVYLQDFPAEALQDFLDSTGLTFRGSAPYLAEEEDRTVAVAYDASSERLSVTAVKP